MCIRSKARCKYPPSQIISCTTLTLRSLDDLLFFLQLLLSKHASRAELLKSRSLLCISLKTALPRRGGCRQHGGGDSNEDMD